MNAYVNWYHEMEQMQRSLRQHEEKIDQLEQKLEAMQRELQHMAVKKAVHIEKVEYRFDQLKVETLEGVLNIGFTPPGTDGNGTIDDVSLEGSGMSDQPYTWMPAEQNIYDDVRQRMAAFWQDEAMAKIHAYEEQFSTVLGSTYRSQMVQDLQKQVEKRIGYYLQKHAVTSENAHEVADTIYDKTRTDVLKALEKHFKQLKGEPE